MSPRARFEKLPEEKRDAILDAATEEFAANGYEGSSLNQIIAAAGISKGAMYYYFDDKYDLFMTVMERYAQGFWDAFEGEWDNLGAVDDFWGFLEGMFDVAFNYTSERRTAIMLAKCFYELPADQWTEGRLGALFEEKRLRFTRLLDRGQELGQIRSDLPGDLLVGLMFAVGETMDRHILPLWDTLDLEGRRASMRTSLDLMKRLLEKK